MKKSKITGTSLCLLALVMTGCQTNSSSNNPSQIVSSGFTSQTSLTPTSSSEVSEETTQKPTTTSEESTEKPTSSSSEITSNSTSEESSIPSEGDYVVFNEENPNAIDITIGQLLSKPRDRVDNRLYRVTGTMQYVNYDKYGKFDLTDSTGSICVFSSSLDNTTITGSGSNYSFHFPSVPNFREANLHGGDIVTIECLYSVYQKSPSDYFYIPELQGYITSATRMNRWKINPLSYSKPSTYSGNYYNSIGNATGTSLGTALHNLMIDTHTKSVSYKSLTNHYHSTDAVNGQVRDFYSNKSISKTNREHVWPQSQTKDRGGNQLWGESGGGCDLNHVRACEANINSLRGNKAFAPMFDHVEANSVAYAGSNSKNYYSSKFSNTGVWEPSDEIKGDVARTIAYCFVHYSTFYGGKTNGMTGELFLHNVIQVDESEMGNLLRRWNALDPVSEIEINRNNYVFNVQGNRNPFIDNPSYMDKMAWPN